jgi:hypothetical protein
MKQDLSLILIQPLERLLVISTLPNFGQKEQQQVKNCEPKSMKD